MRLTLNETGAITSTLADKSIPRSCLCRVVRGPDEGSELLIGTRPLVVGAGEDTDLLLSDPKVSRRHVQVQLVEGGVAVRDLDSTNGTFCDGARIGEATVPIGSSIQLGGTTLRLVAGTAPRVAPSPRERFGGLVGSSPLMREIFAILELAGQSDATVLLQGDSGTGKEMAARAVHDHSDRAGGRFEIFDCSAVQEQLIDSQLFGHVKGAFTGAVGDRKGAFVQADSGTLFLDEIGELPLSLQPKLLRAIETRRIKPVGSDNEISVNTRVIAATHRDLEAMVARGAFRFDLYHRMAVVHILMPPLRACLDDLPILIRHFYEGRGVDPGEIEGDNLTLLQRHAWPGNVRELRNLLERAWVLAGTGQPRFSELQIWLQPSGDQLTPSNVDATLPFKEAKDRAIEKFERQYLATAYDLCERNISRTARHAGINRRYLRDLLKKHGLYQA